MGPSLSGSWIKPVRLLACGLVITAFAPDSGAATRSAAQVYYISPMGSDAGAGSSSMPFLNLERAQAAMRSSSIKTACLMSGIYPRTNALILLAADAGETWRACPGQVPVLEGGNTTMKAIEIHADNIAIERLTIRNFAQSGIWSRNVSNLTISNNVIRNIFSTGGNQGGVVMMANLSNARVTHNLIENIHYAGIMYANNPAAHVGNLAIEYNAVYNACTVLEDCGAIYADDRSHSTTGIVIRNNVIGNYGGFDNLDKAIYLDDELSYTTVANNIVYGTGEFVLQIHGGDHNVVRNNIFDIGGASKLGLYQFDTPKWTNYGMAGNVFTCNIIYSATSHPGPLWTVHLTPADAPLNDTQNLYWSQKGPLPNTGDVVDTLPATADPGFVGPGLADYSFRSGKAPNFCNFRPIDASQVGPLHDQ